MKTGKIVLALLLAFTFSFSGVHADAKTIKDIDKSTSFAKDAITALAEKGIIGGDQQGNFNPTKPVSKSELVVLLVKALNLDTTNLPETATFADVPKNHWAFKYVETAYRAGIVNGESATKFGINSTTSREQIASMFVRALDVVTAADKIELKSSTGLTDKNSISTWATRDVDIALTTGLMTGKGNNNFAPKANATKEQAAVVLNRFLQDQSNMVKKANDTYGINKDTKLVVNGDLIAPKYFTQDENGNVFVSKQFIDKFVQQSAEDASVYNENKELSINTATTYGAGDVNSLWFKVGSLNAYKNIESNEKYNKTNPYTQEDELKDSVITLELAPIEKDNTIYVSLKDLAKLLGIDYASDAARNRISIGNKFLSKYPNFKNAANNAVSEKFIGTMNTKMEVSVTDMTTKEQMKTQMDNQTIVNNDKAYSYSKVKMTATGQATDEFETKEIMTKEKVYSLDSDNKWIEYNKQAWEAEYGQGTLDGTDSRLPASFLTSYDKLPFVKAGIVMLDGVAAEKYTAKIDSKGMQYFVSEEVYNQMKDLLTQAYGGTEKYDIEFYVVDHQIVKQVIRFAGQISDPNSSDMIEVKISLEVNYSNIGAEGTINLPNPADIKQPQQ